jgi:hypothetical protein
MNLEQLINEINKDLDDSLENEELLGWINRCMDDLSPIAQYQKSAAISLVVDQKEYDLPSDYIRLVEFINGDVPLSRVTLKDFSSTGYKLWGNKLILQPTPDQEGTCDLYYEAKLPYLVNLEDEPQIPSQFHDLFIHYTVARARYQDEEENLQLGAWSEYKKRKDEFVTFLTQADEQAVIEGVY